jgi:hypothetical protein
MNECVDYTLDPLRGTRRVVCAAMKNDGMIVLGARHYDQLMRNQIRDFNESGGRWRRNEEVQGFIDQWCNFMTRTEAWLVAEAAGQIL